MKTKSVPYCCPVCQGSGEQKVNVIPQDSYRFLVSGDIVRRGDEWLSRGVFEEVPVSESGFTISKRVENLQSYRRKVEVIQAPKCKACNGTGLVWGTETDDSITINPTPYVWPPVVTSDKLPWAPYKPFEPYTGDPWPYTGITWCASAFDPGTQKYEVISSGTDTKPCCSCSLKGNHTPDCVNY